MPPSKALHTEKLKMNLWLYDGGGGGGGGKEGQALCPTEQ